jgi:8-oxo-dGTP pyrophosphatase MutT (NUDIX family)
VAEHTGPSPELANLHSVGCGGWVIRVDGAVLLVRMTYGASLGKLMIPGGHADADEHLPTTAAREVREETGLTCRVDGLVMVRQRLPEEGPRNLYFVFAMTPIDGDATPQLSEVSECVWLSPEAILARDDVQPIAAELAAAWHQSGGKLLSERALTWQSAERYRLWAG